jgi:hypothetical protein
MIHSIRKRNISVSFTQTQFIKRHPGFLNFLRYVFERNFSKIFQVSICSFIASKSVLWSPVNWYSRSLNRFFLVKRFNFFNAVFVFCSLTYRNNDCRHPWTLSRFYQNVLDMTYLFPLILNFLHDWVVAANYSL